MFGCTGHCIDFFSITLWFFLSRVLFLPLIPAATDLTMLYWDNFYKTFMSASKCGISGNDHELIQPIADMRESISLLIDAYEQQNITTIQFVLTQRLIPSFLAWQHELGQRIRPAVLS